MKCFVRILSALALVGCLSSRPTAPAPVNFHSSRSAKEATQAAAVTLTGAGFRVEQSDTIGNALRANRTATHNGNQQYVVCTLPKGSDAAANRQTVLAVSFRAVPKPSGSDISISSKVTTSYPGYEGTATQVPASDSDCVSNGTIEQQLTSVLR
jgi:hypothetical protein